MRSRPSVVALGLALTAASCNLWPGDLGRVDMPAERSVQELPRRSFESESVTPPRSVAEDVEAIRERAPSPAGEEPRAVQEAGDSLVPLTVSEMRALVLGNNLDLEVALLDPEIAKTRISAEEGRFDALIGSRFAYRRKDSPRLDGSIVDFSSGDPALDGGRVKLTEVEQEKEQLELGLGIALPLPTGGTIAVETLLDEKNTIDPQRFEQYLAATKLSFSQPLLRDAGPDASLAPIRLARVDHRATQVRTKLKAMRILAGAEKAYWRLYATRRFLDVRSEQFRVASENLELVRRRVAEGLTPRVEIARAEVGVYGRLESLIVAETEWRLRQRDLKVYLASDRFPLRGERMVDVSTDPLLAGLELDADALLRRALIERPDLIEIELGILREGIRADYRQNQVLPLVNLDFQYGVLGRDDAFGSAFESQWGFDNPDLWVGLTFEVPLTNQRRRAQLEESLLGRAQRLASRAAREQMVRGEVYNMVDVIQRNWQRIVAARQNVIVAGVNYNAERRQFEQGFRTMREVLEALADLGDAQIREIRAIVDYQVSQIDLAFATGTLLGYSRVDLSPLDMPESSWSDSRGF